MRTTNLDLAAVFARNRALYGNTRMEADGDGGDGHGEQHDGAATTGDHGSQRDGQQATTTTPKPGPPPTPTTPNPFNGWDGKVESLPDDVQRMIRDARGEAAKDRTAAKEQAAKDAETALTQRLGKALGLVKDDEPVDPEKLTADLTASQAAQRDTAVELAIFKASNAAGANPDRLLDSRAFMSTTKDIDPTDGAAIAKAIKDAVDKDPSLKARAAGASSADHTGGSGEGKRTQPRSLHEAVGGHYGS